MMISRESQISLETTRYYHCVNRCVLRAFLCGNDPVSGKDLNHRKEWMPEYIRYLSTIFSIRVCAYAIMSNHYHLLLYVDLESVETWSEQEVYERWKMLFRRAVFDSRKVEEWRRRQRDISWFMRCFNETIARDANQEVDMPRAFLSIRCKRNAMA